jgi:CHAT domain-containing protein
LKAYEIRRATIGQNPRNDSKLLLDIALLYDQNKDFNIAEQYYLQSLKMVEEKLSNNMPFYDDMLYYISTFYVNNSFPTKAVPYLNKTFKINNSNINQTIRFLSTNEFENIRKEQDNKQNFPLSFLQSYPTQYPEINMGCYENELLVKNLSLRNQQRIKTSIEKSDDALLKNKYQQFIDNKRQIAKLEELPIAKRSQDYESLKTVTEIIEKDLTRQSSAFADAKKSLSISWKQVQDKLQPNEVAIDFVAYNYYNKKWTDSIVYAAFVVEKGFKAPKYIPLFEKKQLDFLLHRGTDLQDSIRIDKHYTDKAISDLFFKPLEKDLEGKTTIYLSPAGLGHQIDFSALPASETQTLGEKYQVHVLGSTADLLSYNAARLDKTKSIEFLLYGGINYNKSNPNAEKKQELIEVNYAISDLRTRSGISGFDYLPGTNDEVKQIAQLGKENGFANTILNEATATEESIKQLDGRTTPYVLHLATHGFFFADPKQELPKENLLSDSKATMYKTAEDPMMRSGLLFAGANKYWNTTTENLTTDDGILTANEISNLDLSACQLVVLSACETGLGTINGSEGVFGLQRAFKMAGVKNIIMSLWKVPDAQTAELFSIFYKECLGGKSIHDAFQLAQAKMRAKYSPYYWAGFVLLE